MDQMDLLEDGEVRSMLDVLLEEAGLYSTTKDYLELMDFIVRMRNFAPFNAMLLQIQRPGLRFAASRIDWHERFGRQVFPDARPLLIMWPFGPVALVYDVADTTGDEALPNDVASCFRATGEITPEVMASHYERLRHRGIQVELRNWGDGRAGQVKCVAAPSKGKNREKPRAGVYEIEINVNHTLPTQFCTLAHELAHLFLGHLGEDAQNKIPKRDPATKAQREIEAESVAHLLCRREGVIAESEKYLHDYVEGKPLPRLDIYQITKAVGHIEALLGIAAPLPTAKPVRRVRRR